MSLLHSCTCACPDPAFKEGIICCLELNPVTKRHVDQQVQAKLSDAFIIVHFKKRKDREIFL
jgi:hypothetical protein